MLAAVVGAVAGGVIQPACQCITNLCNCVARKVDYVKDIDTNFNELKYEAESLYKMRTDVQDKIKSAEFQMKKPTNVCQHWIEEVNKAEEKVKALEIKYNNGRKWLCGWCPFFSRLNLSKDMGKMMEKVRKLQEDGKFENGIVVDMAPEAIAKGLHPGRKKEIPPSHQAIEEKIIDFLNDQAVKTIGIWGMAGVGKTTILKKLMHNVEITKKFDIVIWAEVTKKPSVQQQIIQWLEISVGGVNNSNAIGERISAILATRKYLFLLDDVQEFINLHDVGIRENDKDSKVVFATRDQKYCNHMEADERIEVTTLSEREAWKLFEDKVGDVVEYPRIRELAEQVFKYCGGLPNVIDIVAKSLRGQDECLWRDTLRTLKYTPQNKYLDEILRTLKLGYDRLTDDARKNCFLYGALYPEEGEICEDYLMECWKAEGFIVGVEKLRAARDRGHDILEELISKSLLKRVRVRYVQMHMMLRRLALEITSPNEKKCKLLVRTRKETQEVASEEEWKGSKRVSLVDNQLCCLPERLDCRMLSTLLLQRNPDLTLIPESFFGSMHNLRVLDLHGTGILTLPSSLFSLTSLKALYLNSCRQLVELPTTIKALDDLEVLDIRGTQIINVPIEPGKLAYLKCLRFSFIDVGRHNHVQETPARVMFHQVLSRFLQLEELSIDVEGNDPGWNDILDIVVQEMSVLEELSSLCFYFSRLECLQNFIGSNPSWKKKLIESFKILVGSHGSVNSQGLDDSEYKIERFLRFSSGEDIHPTILEVLGNADAFELVGHKSVQKFSDFEIEKMTQLKVCLIEGCNEIESINNSGIRTTKAALKFLQKLEMINLPKLRCIWEGQLYSGSFAKLTTLTLKGCPEMEYIFSRGVIKQLSKLQKLRVENCSKIEQIITEADNEIQECSVLPELLTLTLIELPKLVKICREELVWRSLEKIQILACEELKRLPLRTDNGKKLRLIECEENWWRALVWEDSKVEGMLRPLCRFS